LSSLRSEFLLEHGMLDAVVPRKELKPFRAGAGIYGGVTTAASHQLPAQPTHATIRAELVSPRSKRFR